MRRRPPRYLREWGPAVALTLALLAAWELGVRLAQTPEWLLPAPSRVMGAFVEAAPQLGPHLERTLVETAVGLVTSLVTGLAMAAALELLPGFRRALYPLLVVSQTIPTIALAPLLVVWFGFGLLPRVIVVTLVCFFPVTIAAAQGLASADPDAMALVRSMGASRWQLFRLIQVPSALPSIFAGWRIAATYAVVGAVISEWIGASKGLGIFMVRSANSYLTARVFAIIALTSLLSVALFGAVQLAERALIPWYLSARKVETWEEIE